MKRRTKGIGEQAMEDEWRRAERRENMGMNQPMGRQRPLSPIGPYTFADQDGWDESDGDEELLLG